MVSVIAVRDYNSDDIPFIYSSWLRSVREDFEEIPSEKFFPVYKSHIAELLKKSRILVACNPEDESHIFGYLVFREIDDVRFLHWAYTKGDFRRLGVFDKLISAAVPNLKSGPVVITYKNNRREKIYEKYNMVYMPEYRGL